jgi:hypothetical protein
MAESILYAMVNVVLRDTIWLELVWGVIDF